MNGIGTLAAGRPYPLGATWDGEGTNFAVFSEHATALRLCLFDDGGRHETARLALPECTDGVWHGYLPGARPGLRYGYRAEGPYQPAHGFRFNASKLLLDPYARQIAGELHWSDALYGYRTASARGDLSRCRRDSAAAMPKAVVVDALAECAFDWGDDRPPRVPWSDSVIYETHLRGFTRLRTDLPPNDRGTFGALGQATTVDYLRRLGVTAVELLPVQAFVSERWLLDKGLVNYWGYNPLAWFAPQPAYLSDGTLGQIKWAVKQLHAAGIEVLLDVVYNHTCEGDERGPTLSLRGLDNTSYYRLLPNAPRHAINDSGCGNTLNFSHGRVIQLVLDSLRHWVTEFHVDGFRFDLGTTLGRESHGFESGAGFFDALLQDPVLAPCKLITEPWDLGPGGYQLGHHPPGMAEWNDRYRDDLRRFWRGDAGTRGALAARLQGSAGLFDHRRRRPWASVNFVTAHDGFTLRDLVSHADKHNEANGEDNRDGANENLSRNWGAEGPSEDAAIEALRGRVQRALLATLLCSHGTPMLLGGDEFGRTQHGNNNAYCQDTPLSWYDWTQAEAPAGRALRDYVAALVAIRRRHRSLAARDFMHGRTLIAGDLIDIEWFDESGEAMNPDKWSYGEGRLLAVRRAVPGDASLLLVNNSEDARRFMLPTPRLAWRQCLDSAAPDWRERVVDGDAVEVAAHSVVLLVADPQAGHG